MFSVFACNVPQRDPLTPEALCSMDSLKAPGGDYAGKEQVGGRILKFNSE